MDNIMYQYDQKPDTSFTPEAQRFLGDAKNKEYIVLCGRNNCGKSFILKTLAKQFGEKASYLGPARYQNFNLLGYFTPNRRGHKRTERYRQFVNQLANDQKNLDNSPLNLQQAIAELTDEKRYQLIEIMENLLGSRMELKLTVPDNSMSQKYISVDGHNISYTSSGYRLITTLVTSLLDDDYDTFLIDEPELGISPETQAKFSDFLFDHKIRSKYFSHIKTLILATHSTIFLDRCSIANNYFVEKKGHSIDIKQVKNVNEINNIHFFLLGNRLETLHMPSAIVIVEGKCDYKYIKRVFGLRYENSNISLIQANGDSRIKEIFNLTKNFLGDIQRSPYRDRILIILDKVHGGSIVNDLKNMGLPESNIIVWSRNGIEYFYPSNILQSIFNSSDEPTIEGGTIKLNGIEYKKNELVDLVVDKMDKTTEFPEEFEHKLLRKIENILA